MACIEIFMRTFLFRFFSETMRSPSLSLVRAMSELWSAAQLAVFARVIELNGFSAAARAYQVPKVAISRAIADLEKSIGVQLMRRTTRRIFLTAAGEAVLPHARAIGAEVE